MLFGRMYPGTAAGLGAIRGLTFCDRSEMFGAVSWDRPFAEPIELPKGKKLITLRDAALYITKRQRFNFVSLNGLVTLVDRQ